jgi:hypothetical protein
MAESDVPVFRRRVGILLRTLVVLVAGCFWVVCIWWWMACLSVVAVLGLIVFHPVLYPVIYTFAWLRLAYRNSSDPVLPDYWTDYPVFYLEWGRKYVGLGLPTLSRWLLEGTR